MRWLLFILLAFFPAVIYADNVAQTEGEAMKLTSPEFENNSLIPVKFTCEGEDINPALDIHNIPAGTEELVLIVDDPDAPMGTWVHWVAYNIPVVSQIKENNAPGTLGVNNSGRKEYHGPCPPSGTHRYFFKIYSLDKKLDLPLGLSKEELEQAMKGHILGKAELIGLYKRSSR